MRAVIQRVDKATVSIEDIEFSKIGEGLLIFLGIELEDSIEDSIWLANKIVNLRIFNDCSSKMNNSILDIDGEIIVISQFTLHAKTKKGNRPSFINAAKSDQAKHLYENFKNELKQVVNKDIKSGRFGADMNVGLINNGPVTIIIDTKNKQ